MRKRSHEWVISSTWLSGVFLCCSLSESEGIEDVEAPDGLACGLFLIFLVVKVKRKARVIIMGTCYYLV